MLRPVLPLALLLLAGCAHRTATSSRPAPAWIEWNPPNLPGLCLPAPATKLDREQRDAWSSGVTHMKNGAFDQAKEALQLVDGGAGPSSIVNAARLDGPESPAMTALYAAARQPVATPCLRHSALLFATLLNDDETAADLLPTAESSLANAGQVGALTALRQLNESGPTEALLTTLNAQLQIDPDYLPLVLYRGVVNHLLGHYPAAVPDLTRVAHIDPQYDAALRDSLRQSDDLPGYLRYASRANMPLGDGGSLATAEDPVAAFRDLLGVGPKGTLTATIETSEGPLVCSLMWEHAPITVGSFVGLARGSQAWKDPQTGQPGVGALYDGTIFHRVIPGFMIQGGDPTGTGAGGPGYRFIDETQPVISMDRPGLLAMANSGPATNGSQWFITEAATTFLDGKHTVFGECTPETLEAVMRISRMPRDEADRPQEPVVIEHITVVGE